MKRLRHGADVFVRTCRDAIIVLTIGGLLSAIVGQILTDRIPLASPLMYLPLPFFALAVLPIDLWLRGRTLRGPRFSLTGLALVALAIQTPQFVGVRFLDPVDPHKPTLRLLQWNVMWGGDFVDASNWDAMEQRIAESRPDIVVLSEAPNDDARTNHLRSLLGDDWHVAGYHYVTAASDYWARMKIFSRYPVRVVATRKTMTATAALVQVDAPTPLRLLVVDAISGLGDKTPELRFFAETAKAFGDVDLIVGDFNAISQSHGFGLLRDLGYRDASSYGLALRPTWPSVAPVFQLDHVMLASNLKLVGVDTFYHFGSDHRGTIVDLRK